MEQIEGITWLSENDYSKARTQLKMSVTGVFTPFRLYGMDVYIPGAITEIVRLSEDFGLRVRGVDKIINLDLLRGRVCDKPNKKDDGWR
ncbi:MAG: hypothetical protein JRD89_16205 [Deltaproteobacteria bacterium]|nr:hypothetical protein [Deltaproteobacteria bacterium]